MSQATLTEGVNIPNFEAMFDTMRTAPNRVLQHSPGPNPQIGTSDRRAAMNGTRTCIIEGCDEASRSRGRCHNHYQQWLYAQRRTAQSRAYRTERLTLEQRFHAKYERGADSQCWEWQAARREFGHGVFTIDGVSRIASRIALEIATGTSAPEGLMALHRCDNPPCVNPKHLYWGTRQDNSDDAVARGRIPLGEAKAQAVLTEAQVVEIRERYAAGELQADIAAAFHVTAPTIRSISLGLKWKHVAGPISQPRRKK